MAIHILIVAFMAMLPLSQAHFAFVRLSHNDVWLEPTRYIRNKTSPFEELYTPYTNVNTREWSFPTFLTDYTESIRCGRDHMAHAAATDILPVRPGDTIEVAHVRVGVEDWTDEIWYNCPENRGSCAPFKFSQGPDRRMDINHPGPFLAHLSKVPDEQDVRTYDGSGEWVKIYTLGLEPVVNPNAPINWLAYNNQQMPGRFRFRLPAQVPAGQYLLRMDMIWSGTLYEMDNGTTFISNEPQIYATCAQIEVESNIVGSLPKGILIPENISHTSPGMLVSWDMTQGKKLDLDFVYPGGPLWDGETLVQDRPVILPQ